MSGRDRRRHAAALLVLIVAGIASLATEGGPPTVVADTSGNWWVADGTPVSVPIVVRLSAVEHKSTTLKASLAESDRVSVALRMFDAVSPGPSALDADGRFLLPGCAAPPCEWDLSLDIGDDHLPVTETRVHWQVRAELQYDGDVAPTLTIEAGSQPQSPTIDAAMSVAIPLVALVGVIVGLVGLSAAAVTLPRRRRRLSRSDRPVRSSSAGRRNRSGGPRR